MLFHFHRLADKQNTDLNIPFDVIKKFKINVLEVKKKKIAFMKVFFLYAINCKGQCIF